MELTEFPLILSPNLGCPHIVSIKQLEEGDSITLIIAGQYGEISSPTRETFNGKLFIRPSDGNAAKGEYIPLCPAGEPEEITDWNTLPDFSNVEHTRSLINSELHYNILGKNTRYWKLEVIFADENIDYKSLLREIDGKYFLRLYDLILRSENTDCEKVNYHSLQFVNSVGKECNFIHITDLHVATRNDQILGEALKAKCKRKRGEIVKSYINFNDNFREFIDEANKLADCGELDFIIITGDLVDFAFHGWNDIFTGGENNWKTFVNMCIGSENERLAGNSGLKVAIYTSTGNHDWRLHPFNPTTGQYHKYYGLEKDELKNYDYKSFDSKEYPDDERTKASQKLTRQTFEKLKVDAFSDSLKIKLAKFLVGKISARLMIGVGGLSLSGVGVAGYKNEFIYAGVVAILGAILWGLKKYLTWWTRKIMDFIVDNPLHAEATALHYYLLHINSFFDYAFRFGKHSFIVMDTGADVFMGQLLDGKTLNDIKKMSIEDNILGGSPDSRSFDSEQIYYNWSQIVWLEGVLKSVAINNDASGNLLVFLHAPPINPPSDDGFDWSEMWERNRKDPKWISNEECNLTYGSINHYLSQFMHLCTGNTENGIIEKDGKSVLRKVDLVFAGHAHRNIEFRIETERNDNDEKSLIRIYSDIYSEIMNSNDSEKWWTEYKPIIVQTASCGVKGKNSEHPPYYRKVRINDAGQIIDFKVNNLNGIVSLAAEAK